MKVTPEGAIQLRWQSESNATYRIEYTPQLSDSITWNVLYEDVASQGTSPDWTISGSGPLQSYYPVYTGANGYDWVRLSEFSFGSSKLRWMSMLTCNNLVDSVYQDCYNKFVLPVNDQLHLLCGAKSYIFLVSNFGSQYSAALTGSAGVARKSIVDSWFYAGTKTQGIQPGGAHMSVDFRVIGWPNCFGDDLVNYQSPNSGNPADITFQDARVFTYP